MFLLMRGNSLLLQVDEVYIKVRYGENKLRSSTARASNHPAGSVHYLQERNYQEAELEMESHPHACLMPLVSAHTLVVASSNAGCSIRRGVLLLETAGKEEEALAALCRIASGWQQLTQRLLQRQTVLITC